MLHQDTAGALYLAAIIPKNFKTSKQTKSKKKLEPVPTVCIGKWLRSRYAEDDDWRNPYRKCKHQESSVQEVSAWGWKLQPTFHTIIEFLKSL